MKSKCSVCKGDIDQNFCPNCGQYIKPTKITTVSIIEDLFGSVFSLEKSFLINIKLALLKPKVLIENYWSGYRGYYYSPSKFLVIASVLFVLQLMLVDDFFGIKVFSKAIPQFSLLIVNLTIFSTSGFIIYLAYKRSFYEHIILNAYTVSLWSIIFLPISVLLNLLNANRTIETGFLLLLQFLIIVWNARVFEMNQVKRLIYIAIHSSAFAIIIASLSHFGTT